MTERTGEERVVRFDDAGTERASTPDVVVTPESMDGPDLAGATEGEADTDQLRAEIEQTRSDLSATIDAIQDKLNPHHLVEQAKEAAHDAAVNVVDEAKETVRAATLGKVEHMVSSVTETARGLVGGTEAASSGPPPGSSGPVPRRAATIVETVRQNPLPAALAAFGLGWLWTHRTPGASISGSSTVRNHASFQSQGAPYQSQVERPQAGSALSDAASRVGDTAGQVAGQAQQVVSQAHDAVTQTANQAQDTVGQWAGQAKETAQGLVTGTQAQAQQVQSQLQRLQQENPLAIGAVGLGLGVAVGLVLRQTRLESHLMGAARDTVMDKAQETAQSALQKVQSVAQEAGQAVQSAAQQQGLTN